MLELDVLDRPDAVQREGARARDRPARLHRDPGYRDPERPALAPDDLRERIGQGLGRERVMLAGIGDAEPAAQVHFRQGDAVLPHHLRMQPEQPAGRHLEAVGVEDL